MEKEKKELRHIYFPVETIEKIKKLADEDSREPNNLIVKIVKDYVKNVEVK